MQTIKECSECKQRLSYWNFDNEKSIICDFCKRITREGIKNEKSES